MKKVLLIFSVVTFIFALTTVLVLTLGPGEPATTTAPTVPTTRPATTGDTTPTAKPTEPTKPTEPNPTQTTAPTEPVETTLPTEPTVPATTILPTAPEHLCYYVEIENVESTCTQEGYVLYQCNCGNSFKSILGLKAHEYTRKGTEAGYDIYACIHCGDTQKVPAAENNN